MKKQEYQQRETLKKKRTISNSGAEKYNNYNEKFTREFQLQT